MTQVYRKVIERAIADACPAKLLDNKIAFDKTIIVISTWDIVHQLFYVNITINTIRYDTISREITTATYMMTFHYYSGEIISVP